MKSFDDIDKNIDKYYEGSLDGATCNELKEALDKMSIINKIVSDVPISINVNSIVEEGQEIRLSIKLKKATIKFLIFAILVSVLIGFIYTKVSLEIIVASQGVMLMVLLIINLILVKRKTRREV